MITYCTRSAMDRLRRSVRITSLKQAAYVYIYRSLLYSNGSSPQRFLRRGVKSPIFLWFTDLLYLPQSLVFFRIGTERFKNDRFFGNRVGTCLGPFEAMYWGHIKNTYDTRSTVNGWKYFRHSLNTVKNVCKFTTLLQYVGTEKMQNLVKCLM